MKRGNGNRSRGRKKWKGGKREEWKRRDKKSRKK